MSGALIDFVRAHAPALVLLAPLAAMVLAALAPSGRGAWAIGLLGAAALTACALVAALSYERRLSYPLGGWAAPLGVELRIDGLSAYALVVLGLVALFGTGGGIGALREEIDRARQPLAVAAAMAALAGAAGLLVAGDLFVMFVCLQLIWISLGALTAMGADHDRRAGPAALNVVVAGAMGAGLFVLGALFAFMSTGTVDLNRVGGVLSAAEDSPGGSAALALMGAGLAMSAALAPLHAWAVGAFGRGPFWASATLGALLPLAGAVAAGRLIALAASAAAPGLQYGLGLSLSLLGAAGALWASVQAMAARDFRRFIVYAGAAQAGCVAIGFAAASSGGVAGGLFQLVNQTICLFILHASAAALRGNDNAAISMDALHGLGKRAPLLSLAISAALLSLIGAPLTAGFLSRWSLLQATFEARLWWGAAAIILSSLAAVIFAGRIFERMYLRAPDENAPNVRAAWLAPGLVVAAGLILAFGVDGAAPLRAADAAAASLSWGGRP